jgi:ABC-type Fe3+/spermidine/putrescine transport system ATPase subunit
MGHFEQPDQADMFNESEPVAGMPPYRHDTNMIFQHDAFSQVVSRSVSHRVS